MNQRLIHAARQWFYAGYCVFPAHPDGSKRPFSAWKQYQSERMPWNEVEHHLASGRYTGIGVICGAVSGNVEMIEIEGPDQRAGAALRKVLTAADSETWKDEIASLWRLLAAGCMERSAGEGVHFFVRVSNGTVPGNQKLAADANGVIAETRGEGGFVIVAPTPSRNGHKPGSAYQLVEGRSPSQTPTVSLDDLDALHYLINYSLDESDLVVPSLTNPNPLPKEASEPSTVTLDTPWDDFATRTTWAEILEPHGWQKGVTASDGRTHWTRPGKNPTDGTSATTIDDGPMYVFSTNSDLPAEEGMSKQHVHALLNHGGDHTIAACELATRGFGKAPASLLLPSWVPDLPPIQRTDEELLPEDAAFAEEVQREFRRMLVQEHAKTNLAKIRLGAIAALEGTTLTDFLTQPDDPIRYRIDQLWPSEGRVSLSAAAKSGKTTMVAANLIPCLVDGGEFLGRFQTEQVTDGRVVLLNMEVGSNTLRTWMRDSGIVNTDKVVVSNMRGKASALALQSEQGRRKFANWLQSLEAQVVILDPLAPVLATLQLNENDNSDVARFFAWWAEALDSAGVRDDLIVHHTGHSGERSRGASRLLDEPDAIWTLGKEAEDTSGEFASLAPASRYLSAYGRDVEIPAKVLDFDPHTRRITMTDTPRSRFKVDRTEQKVIALMRDQKARSKNQICEQVGGARNAVWEAATRLVENGTFDQIKRSDNGRGMLLVMPEINF